MSDQIRVKIIFKGNNNSLKYTKIIFATEPKKLYVPNWNNNNVSVIDTTTNTVTATVNVGNHPSSWGEFIGSMKLNPIISWSSPADITYGTALSSTQFNAVASVPGTFVYTPAEGTVLSAGTHILHVDFTPDDTATLQYSVSGCYNQCPYSCAENPANNY